MAKLNILACADRKYEDFAPIFIAACLWSNPDATVEIGVENSDQFNRANLQAVSVLSSAYGRDAFLVRDAIWHHKNGRKILPNSVRFLTEPMMPSEYVYISDIDIVTLQSDIANKHVAFMARTGLPYSNWLRTGHERLTGLHFCRRDWQYPLPPYEDLIATRINDEQLLYMLVRRKLGFDPPIIEKFRPLHGIHMSPSRTPNGSVRNGRARPGWYIKPHREGWNRFRNTGSFRDLEPHLSERIRTFVAQIDDETAGAGNGANESGLGSHP